MGPAVACVATAMLLAATVVVGVSLARTPQGNGMPAALAKLSSTSLDARLNGIGTLQKIMSASPSDQPSIVRALSAFIRHRSPPAHPTARLPRISRPHWTSSFPMTMTYVSTLLAPISQMRISSVSISARSISLMQISLARM